MFKNQYFFFILILIFFGCANIGAPPRGGEKDEVPPVLDIDESTENFQTNFKKKDIVLVFDEYIQLKDVFNQVIISPPLEKRWQLTNKLKTVKFEFDKDEVLRADATYTINFGESVQDYTEGNPVPNLRFVFSTGDYIDSMEVSGNIVNALTGTPVEGALLMLYDNLADSVVRTERPFYFAKTDKSGKYKIQNVKADTFKIFALKDGDLNYLFNQETELIGFPDSVAILSKDKEILPLISMFLERPSVRFTSPKNSQFGKVNLAFNQDPFDINVNYEDIGQQVFLETDKDSIKVWYNQGDSTSWQVFMEQGDDFKDTFLIEPANKSAFFNKSKLIRANVQKAAIINLNPTKSVRILFNHPLEKIDSTAFLLLEDSTLTPVIPSLKMEQRELVISYRWKEKINYQLQILPGALSDIFQIENKDTILQNYRVLEKKAFGNLQLKVIDLIPDQHYIINLYLKNNTNLVESMPVSGQTIFEKSFKTISAGEYLVEIITDLNGNGRWDSGSYDLKSQPEPFFSKKLENLRENWEVNAEVSLKN
jgi:Big-like domain-containing protein